MLKVLKRKTDVILIILLNVLNKKGKAKTIFT